MIRYNTKRYWGYSTEEKPIDAQIGDRFLEIDTNVEYVFKNYNKWDVIGDHIPFLKTKTTPHGYDIIKTDETIFNPDQLTIFNSSIFIIEENASYYVLGDLYNNGTIQLNGTLKIGGILHNSGIITGNGIIE